jgi:hypothetical protein
MSNEKLTLSLLQETNLYVIVTLAYVTATLNSARPGNSNRRRRLSTFDLLIKVGCFVK